jgi:hypothetical protein
MATHFSASFCDPFNPAIIDLGNIQADAIIDKFENIDWAGFLRKMESAQQEYIFYSPSLAFENTNTQHALNISAVGSANKYEFYIFYKRPKAVKTFFGLKEKMKADYMTDKTGQTKQDVLDCLNALLNNDMDFLATKIGQ